MGLRVSGVPDTGPIYGFELMIGLEDCGVDLLRGSAVAGIKNTVWKRL